MIILENISKRFGDTVVLDRVHAEIPLRKTTFVLGPSGHGKTVFLKTSIGLLKPEEGRIRFDGREIMKFSKKELYRFWTDIGFVFQEAALIDSLTVGENVSLFLTYRAGLYAPEIRRRVRDLLAYVRLENIEDRLPEELSGGMKKRVAVARGLAKDPPYLFFGEPTLGVDEENARILKDLLARLSRQGDKTTIIATHDRQMVQELADYVIFLKNRRIPFARPSSRVDEGCLKDLYRKDSNER